MLYERILVTPDQLEHIVCELAKKISEAYHSTDKIVAAVMLEGARAFAKDLLAKLDFPVNVIFIKASSYYNQTTSAGTVRLDGPADLAEQIEGKHILVIDDIYDSGRTLAATHDWLGGFHPQSIKTCVLLEKDIPHEKSISIDFLGTRVPDAFVVGYGLDFDGRYRDLPYIAALSPKSGKAASENRRFHTL